MGVVKQLWGLMIAAVVIGGVIIALGTMFPDGEIVAGLGELGEGLALLASAVVDAFGGAT